MPTQKQPNISNRLVDAYLATQYQIITPSKTITLTAMQPSKAADELLINNNAQSLALITAHNPMSQKLSTSENQLAQHKLKQRIEQQWKYLPAKGSDPTGIWPEEPSFCIFDIDLETSTKLGRDFQQHALVFYEIHQEVTIYHCWLKAKLQKNV